MRKFLESFTATHFTILALAAMFVPGALYAIPSFTDVAIEDPNTGARALVNNARAVSVYDSVAGYANSPTNYVNITDVESSDGASHAIYTVPPGKALIIKSWSVNYFQNNAGDDAFVYIYNGNASLDNIQGTLTADSANHVYETGIIVPSGAVLNSLFGCTDGNTGAIQKTYIQGYLVPSGAIPPAAEANGQIVHAGKNIQQGRRL